MKIIQNNLEGFFNTAKALQINGLDVRYAESLKISASAQNGLQYQSCQTVNASGPIYSVPAPSNDYYQEPSNGYERQENFEFGKTNQLPENRDDTGNNYGDDSYQCSDMDGEDLVIDEKCEAQSNKLNARGQTNAADEKETMAIAPQAKRAKRSILGMQRISYLHEIYLPMLCINCENIFVSIIIISLS